jgi:Ca-activated chloride channel family protein
LAQNATQPPSVKLNALVLDRNKRPVKDVRQEEFQIFEDGVAQTISFFSTDDSPVSYGLIIENSGSLKTQLSEVKDAARLIINNSRSTDQALLVRFIDQSKTKMLVDMTSNQAALLDGLNLLKSEMGQTALIDAVYASVNYISKFKTDNGHRRRVLILITDGEDRASHYKQDQLFELLRKTDVQIYAIGLIKEFDSGGGFIRKSPRATAIELLERLTKETGGRAFFPDSKSELPKVADEITSNLAAQYLLGYFPKSDPRSKDYRKVQVKIVGSTGGDKRTVITRTGYTAVKQ